MEVTQVPNRMSEQERFASLATESDGFLVKRQGSAGIL
jgi:hypothetical protein